MTNQRLADGLSTPLSWTTIENRLLLISLGYRDVWGEPYDLQSPQDLKGLVCIYLLQCQNVFPKCTYSWYFYKNFRTFKNTQWNLLISQASTFYTWFVANLLRASTIPYWAFYRHRRGLWSFSPPPTPPPSVTTSLGTKNPCTWNGWVASWTCMGLESTRSNAVAVRRTGRSKGGPPGPRNEVLKWPHRSLLGLKGLRQLYWGCPHLCGRKNLPF